jgi:GTPase SAR1 family protein
MLCAQFARGVNFNLKVVVRGARKVGKSTLLSRLTGLPFIEVYEETPEIKVSGVDLDEPCSLKPVGVSVKISNINWSYKNTDDVVKVEVWDVVDRASVTAKRKSSTKLPSGRPQSSIGTCVYDGV